VTIDVFSRGSITSRFPPVPFASTVAQKTQNKAQAAENGQFLSNRLTKTEDEIRTVSAGIRFLQAGDAALSHPKRGELRGKMRFQTRFLAAKETIPKKTPSLYERHTPFYP
jgi:hypothetical protein